MPQSKERWSTSACRITNLGIVVGDRKGNLHYFKMDATAATHTIKRAHSHLGITQLYWNAQKKVLTSYGRNSTLRNYHIDESTSKIIPITSDVLPFAWLASKLDQNIILGFSGNEILLWDYDKRLELFKTNCGGGHRSWDFHSDNFVYIRDKAVNCLKTNRPVELTSSVHSTEMNTMKCLKLQGKIMFISGGEDTTLRFSSVLMGNSEVRNEFVNEATIKSHLSSIRCLHLISGEDNCYKLVTAGGRGQIIYWLLNLDQNGDFLFCKELHSFYEPEDEEIRVMDLSSDENMLFAACSDGSIKIYNLKNDRIELFKVIFYKLRCILKLCVVKSFDMLITMATDGHLVFWKLNELTNQENQENDKISPFYKFKAHASGINAFDFKQIDENKFLCLSGGDDNQICLIMCKCSEGDLSVLHHYTNVESHCAQITGAYLSEKCFFTASLDQKLLMFEYHVTNKLNVTFKAVHNSTISDIKGINVFSNQKHDFDIVLYGLGLELLKLQT